MTTILVDDPDAPPGQEAKGVAECSNMVVAPAIANAVADGDRPAGDAAAPPARPEARLDRLFAPRRPCLLTYQRAAW